MEGEWKNLGGEKIKIFNTDAPIAAYPVCACAFVCCALDMEFLHALSNTGE